MTHLGFRTGATRDCGLRSVIGPSKALLLRRHLRFLPDPHFAVHPLMFHR